MDNLKQLLNTHAPGLYALLAKIRRILIHRGNTGKNGVNKKFKPYKVKPLKSPQADRRKVLHIIANFWTGGSSRLVVDLVEHLGHLYEQQALTLDVPKEPAYTGFPVFVNKQMENPASIRDEINRFRPDIVHVHYLGHQGDKWGRKDWKWYDNVFKALEMADCPVVENINIPTEPYISNLVTHYVYVSNYVKREFGRPGLRDKIIYPGTDFSHFSRPDLLDIPDDSIGMVYRLERDKINEDSIKVFTEIVKHRKNTTALIVGGGNLLKHYRKVVEDAGLSKNIVITGYISYYDLPHYFEKMSVFIAPVHNESFGHVTPMAMNMGIPVAGYHVGALPEIIADESLLAPPGDYKKLAQIVIDLLDDRERRLKIGAGNHKRATQNFSVEAMIRSYREIYETLAPSARN